MFGYSTFTSESVSEGHPDKLCDQISDAILDAALEESPRARVACETLIKDNTVVIAGETSASFREDPDRIGAIAKGVIDDVGYTAETGFDSAHTDLKVLLSAQSENIKVAVDKDKETSNESLGAGDQGMMFGYATNESEQFGETKDMYMPMAIAMAHILMKKHREIRQSQTHLGPDAKCQVTLNYSANGSPIAIDKLVLSTQHEKGYDQDNLAEEMRCFIKDLLPTNLLAETEYLINPSGTFDIGGPLADAGLTGRKIIVDTYGGAAPHGGGAFSGKDASKVDRSGAYAARYIAKNIVAAGLADRCEIQVSYAIGRAEPTSISVKTYGTEKFGLSEERISCLARDFMDLTPQGIIDTLQLTRPIFRKTATFGHFGRNDSEFTWENTDRAIELREQAGV